MSEKACVCCGNSFPLSQFSCDKQTKDGLAVYCKVCKSQKSKECNLDTGKARARRKKWATANAERFREMQRRDNLKRHHAKQASSAEYREANRQRARAYYRANKEHCSAREKLRRQNNPDWDRERHLKMNYGIDLARYNAMLEEQSGVCAICGQAENSKHRRLHVDHCHRTGKVRGLLCNQCNRGLGSLKDDPAVVANALEYLKRYSS